MAGRGAQAWAHSSAGMHARGQTPIWKYIGVMRPERTYSSAGGGCCSPIVAKIIFHRARRWRHLRRAEIAITISRAAGRLAPIGPLPARIDVHAARPDGRGGHVGSQRPERCRVRGRHCSSRRRRRRRPRRIVNLNCGKLAGVTWGRSGAVRQH